VSSPAAGRTPCTVPDVLAARLDAVFVGINPGRVSAAAAAHFAALFVLPSTSPANAVVPWAERLRWFVRLREHLDGR
jgi:G:T/U-mismatch repair DNA glycosylase